MGNANGKAKGTAKGKGAPSKADADNASPQTPTTKKDNKGKATWADQLKEQAEKAHKEMAEEDDAMEEDSSEEEEDVNHAAWIEELKKAEASVRAREGTVEEGLQAFLDSRKKKCEEIRAKVHAARPLKTQLKNLEEQRTKAVRRHAQLAEEIEHLEIVLRAKRKLQTNKAETIKRAVSEINELQKRLAVVETEQQQAAQDAELGAALQNAFGTLDPKALAATPPSQQPAVAAASAANPARPTRPAAAAAALKVKKALGKDKEARQVRRSGKTPPGQGETGSAASDSPLPAGDDAYQALGVSPPKGAQMQQ